MGTILLIILILLLIGALPTWPYSSGWGYYPSGGARSRIFDRLDPPSLEANLMRWEQRSLPRPSCKAHQRLIAKVGFL